MSTVTLPIIHFNDVYRVRPFKIDPKSPETIDVTQFTAMLDDVRDAWTQRPDGARDGLVLFSGDVFSPSVESSVTRGSHMVPVMNAIGPDVSMTGNHDFDFGYLHLTKLIQDTTFPWLLSNVIDETTSRVPEHLLEFKVLERCGVRIGVIGLVEKEWISTVPTWPSNFKYRDMAEVSLELSRRLRDPAGEHRCDIIIALTHARVPNDITLAKAVKASSPSAQKSHRIDSEHGVDLILGGHDHLYYISRGVTSWEGYDVNTPVLGAEHDEGDVLLVKSGTDFRDLSEFTLELVDTPPGSVRKKVIKSINGRHLETKPGSKKSERLTKLLDNLLSSVDSALKVPICATDVEIDLRSSVIRVQEAASSNWFADVLRHAYDGAECMQGIGSDGVFICAGTLRGDSIYGPGDITVGNILEILPFEDPVVVLELDGEAIWAALESSLSTWPAQEGRFPVISGFRVSWNSQLPPGQRVLGVWLLQEAPGSVGGSLAPTPMHSGASTPLDGSSTSLVQIAASGTVTPAPPLIDGDPIPRTKGGRLYRIVTRDYMAQGYDGYDAFKGKPYIVDDENGQLMSAIVRKYLLGSRFVKRMSQLKSEEHFPHLHPFTLKLIQREKARQEQRARRSKSKSRTNLSPHREKSVGPGGGLAGRWRQAVSGALRWSKAHFSENIRVSGQEHMSGVDCIDGQAIRNTQLFGKKVHAKAVAGEAERGREIDDMVVIHPVLDGRLKDEGRR